MIRSMTAFGNAKADLEQGTLALELRSVNSRFLDLYFRLPDELRHVETLRELLTAQLARGKVEIRVSFTRNASADMSRLDPAWLETLSEQRRPRAASCPTSPRPAWWNCSTGRPARQRRARSPGLGRRLPAGRPAGADAVGKAASAKASAWPR